MWLLTSALSREQHLHLHNFGVHEEGLGPQKDWGDGPRNGTTFKHKPNDLSTVYPYGDPEIMDYDTVSLALPSFQRLDARIPNPKSGMKP